MALTTIVPAVAKGATVLAQANCMVNVATNFEHMGGASLPFLLLSSLITYNPAASSAPVTAKEALSDAYKGLVDKYLPGEKVVDVAAPVQHESTHEDGSKMRETKVKFRTSDKELTAHVNLEELYSTVRNGEIPTGQQMYLALLDIIDMLDLNLLGDSITTERLAVHIKEREITVTERLSRNVEKGNSALPTRGNGTVVLSRVTDTHVKHTTLSGEGLESRTLEYAKAENEYRQEQTLTVSQGEATAQFNKGTTTTAVITSDKQRQSLHVEQLSAEGKMEVVFSDSKEMVLSENHRISTVGVNENVHEKPQNWWQKLIGSEVETTTHVYVQQNDKQLVYVRAENGSMQLVDESSSQQVLRDETSIQKRWESGYVSYVPLVGAVTEVGLKAAHGYEITWQDWAFVGLDAASVALLVIPGGQGVGLSLLAGKTAETVATNVVAKATVKSVGKAVAKNTVRSVAKQAAKATLKPQNALDDFASDLSKVFSPERIESKALTKAHNPMREDVLKTMARLDEIGDSVQIRRFLRDSLPNDKAIAHRLYKNYEFLKKNGCLTPDNLLLMKAGKSPFLPGNPPSQLHLDHIVPKSLSPALKADPANLRFMDGVENMARGNRLGRHDLKDMKEVLERYPDIKLGPELQKAVREVLETTPGWKDSTFWQQAVNSPAL